MRRLHGGLCAGQMEADPYGVRGQLVSCGYSGGRPFRAAGTDLTGRRESGCSFFMPVPFPGGGHTTIEHERRTPIAGGNQRKDHSPLHQDRKADRAAAPKGYESPACTDEKAA